MKNAGQSLVEYIMLLGLLLMIGISIFKSDMFKNVFGEDAALFEKLKKQFEYEYRHGLSGLEDTTNETYGGAHESFFKNGKTRFFSPETSYP